MKGLIFIPDISGFTKFVFQVPAEAGAQITREVLNEIIDNSLIDLKLSEVEGDALLFYKFGEPIPLAKMLDSFRQMAAAFKRKYNILKTEYKVNASLSIKFILHYGDLIIYRINDFEKLYGKTLLESHSLLKNGHAGSNYLLITEDYIKAARDAVATDSDSQESPPEKITQYFKNLRNINYYFYQDISVTNN